MRSRHLRVGVVGSTAWLGAEDLWTLTWRNSFSSLRRSERSPFLQTCRWTSSWYTDALCDLSVRLPPLPLSLSLSLSRLVVRAARPPFPPITAVIIPRCKLHNPVTVGISCRFSNAWAPGTRSFPRIIVDRSQIDGGRQRFVEFSRASKRSFELPPSRDRLSSLSWCSIYVFTRKVIRTRRWDFAVYRVGTCVSASARGIMGIPVTDLSIGLLVWSIVFYRVSMLDILFYFIWGEIRFIWKGIKKWDVVEIYIEHIRCF